MSVLIKGMKMPQDIREAIIITRGGKASRIRAGRIIIEGSVEETNVAIELPPHGRLIDADAFKIYECSHCDGWCNRCDCDCLNCKSEHRCSFIEDFDDALIIIGADDD